MIGKSDGREQGEGGREQGDDDRERSGDDWEQRLADAWASLDERDPGEFRALIGRLADELPETSAVALFERACAFDSTGHSDRAVPLYQQALDTGLTGIRRRRAVIQMSSSLRNTGQVAKGVELLTAELDAGPDELDDAVRAFLALCLTDVGREREASPWAPWPRTCRATSARSAPTPARSPSPEPRAGVPHHETKRAGRSAHDEGPGRRPGEGRRAGASSRTWSVLHPRGERRPRAAPFSPVRERRERAR